MIDRRSIVLQIEGQCIHHAATSEREDGPAFARAVADGAINALIRVDGCEAAAEFAAQLSDRVLMGLRTPTDYPLKAVIAPKIEAPPSPTIEPPTPRPMRFFSIFIAGWLCGFLTGYSGR